MLRPILLTCIAVAAAAAGGLQTAVAAIPPQDQAPPHDSATVEELVRQLGDGSYRSREAATRALLAVGAPAKDELLKAVDSPDAEVRYRARLVLAEVLELDRQQRLRDFIADETGKRDHDLPGWKRFRSAVGDNPAARRLFVEMQRSEPELLDAADQGADVAAGAFEARCQSAQDELRFAPRVQDQAISNGRLAAFLFVGADSNVPVSTQAAMYITSGCFQQPFQQAAMTGELSASLRKLVGMWVSRDFGSDSSAMIQALTLALQLGVREAIEPAKEILKDKDSGPPSLRQFAMQIVGRFGTADDVSRIEPLLDDETICASQPVPPNARRKPDQPQVIETQVRDVALAVMLHLTGQQLSDYGFTRAQANAAQLFNTPSLGFAENADREAAIAKWRAWRAERPDGK